MNETELQAELAKARRRFALGFARRLLYDENIGDVKDTVETELRAQGFDVTELYDDEGDWNEEWFDRQLERLEETEPSG